MGVLNAAEITAADGVVGPASATDGVPALFDGTTGKLLKNSTPTGTGNVVRATSPTLVTPVLGVAAGTKLTLTTGTITTSQPGVSLSQTWNDAGVAFTGSLVDITSTASATLSMPVQVRVGGADRFRVYRDAITGVALGAGTNASGQQNLFIIQNGATTEFDVNGGTASFYVGGGYGMELVSGAIRTAGGIIAFNTAFGASPDANFSRISAGVIGVGTGAAGSVAGTLSAGGYLLASGTAIPAGGTAGLGYRMSSTSNFGTFFGSGAPTLSAAKGSLYLRSDGSGTTDRAYINTDGGTTWTALTTAA